MPPAFRNNLGPTACDTPALSAASSLLIPAAIARQNRSCSARPATAGRPGDRNAARVDRFFRMFIATSARACCDDRLKSAPGLPCAMVLTVYFALSPATGLVCHRRPQETCKKLASRELDTSVGVSGPHDFAVRAQCHSSFDKPRPSHPAPNVRDDRETPLLWVRDSDGCRSDLAEKNTGIFLRRGLDMRTRRFARRAATPVRLFRAPQFSCEPPDRL